MIYFGLPVLRSSLIALLLREVMSTTLSWSRETLAVGAVFTVACLIVCFGMNEVVWERRAVIPVMRKILLEVASVIVSCVAYLSFISPSSVAHGGAGAHRGGSLGFPCANAVSLLAGSVDVREATDQVSVSVGVVRRILLGLTSQDCAEKILSAGSIDARCVKLVSVKRIKCGSFVMVIHADF
eukprot:GHVN01087016.1.p1 GENE.GHVN01087016.1~~GHVN01087016.1.p1  ORF type:complete len:183 (-),score=27.56 GHVN01087016.1:1127-1675(-)